MTYAIVTNSEVHAARSLCPRDFIENPCGNCLHGAGQHLATPNNQRNYGRGSGKCTAPGCPCQQYEKGQQFYGS